MSCVSTCALVTGVSHILCSVNCKDIYPLKYFNSTHTERVGYLYVHTINVGSSDLALCVCVSFFRLSEDFGSHRHSLGMLSMPCSLQPSTDLP